MLERTVVVLDTNVVLSAILFGGKPLELVNLWRQGRFESALSPELLAEILTKLRTKFAVPDDLLSEWRDLLESGALHVLPDYKADICRDPKDNMLLDTAAAAKAAYLITGDKDLLELREYHAAKIITVSEALTVLLNG